VVLVGSDLHTVAAEIRTLNCRYQNAKDQAHAQQGSLPRLLRTGAMAWMWGVVNESARRAVQDAEAAFAGTNSTLRRLSRLGVPASSIPALLKLGGLPRMSVSQVKNILIRKRVLPPRR
jgi:hypothetical protein